MGINLFLLFRVSLAVIGIATLYRLDKMLAIKQLVWVTLGLIGYILIVAILPDLRSFAKYKKVYMIITLILMPLALIFGNPDIGGAKNWIEIGPFMFQPSEFGKIALVLYLASALATYEDKKNFKEDFMGLLQPALVSNVLTCLYGVTNRFRVCLNIFWYISNYVICSYR